MLLLASEGERWSVHSLECCEVCAKVHFLGAISDIHFDLWCAEGCCLDQVWDDSVGCELVDDQFGVCWADGAAPLAAMVGTTWCWCREGEGGEANA